MKGIKKTGVVKSAVSSLLKQRPDSYRRRARLRTLFPVFGFMVLGICWPALSEGMAPAITAQEKMSEAAQRQITSLMREKESRTPTQRKIDSQLLYAIKAGRNELAAAGVEKLETHVEINEKNRTVVDIICDDLDGALAKIEKAGAVVISAVINNIRAEVSLESLETIAAWPEVRFIWPKQEMITTGSSHPGPGRDSRAPAMFSRPAERETSRWPGARPDFAARAERVRLQLASVFPRAAGQQGPEGPQTQAVGRLAGTEGERTHRVDQARRTYGAAANGVKIGVISNGIDQWEQLRLLQELPEITVVGGQLPGSVSGNEGAAMLEIIRDLAPGAKLFFAGVANQSIAGFAQAIRALRAAGCDIIVDDVRFTIESPFHDGQAPTVRSFTNAGLVTQAVNEVTADGALYFSSAGNFGNLNDGTSSVYEGDFVDGGTLPLLPGGAVHAFSPGVTNNQRAGVGNGAVLLWWSDPLGNSGNDYDLYLLDSTGSRVVAVSNNIQNGSQDPIETAGSTIAGARIVILKKTGAQNRYLHLQAVSTTLAIATSGEIAGHAMAADAFAVAATPAAQAFSAEPNPTGPYPNAFNSSNRSELFTSDGPRRIFYRADGAPYTPGDVSGTGGILRQKPEGAAADGVTCATPGFERFFGTSAAAPHAAAIAALIKSAVPGITPTQVRSALTASAIDIEAPGSDPETGAGIIMAPAALQAAGAARLPLPVPDVASSGFIFESNPNGQRDPGETVRVNLCLKNAGASVLTSTRNFPVGALEATGNVIDPSGPQTFRIPFYGDLSCQPFTFKVGGDYGDPLNFSLRTTFMGRELGTVTFPMGLIGATQTGLVEAFLSFGALPSGWTTTTTGGAEPWIMDGIGVVTTLVSASGDSSLVSPPIPITTPRAVLQFTHAFRTEAGILGAGIDGGVLEIKIGDGEFQDILEAGGRFTAGGYTGVIRSEPICSEPNPLNSRLGWVSDSRRWSLNTDHFPGLFVPDVLNTEVTLPASAAGQTIQLRWRFGSDCLVAPEGGGWRIIGVNLISGYNAPTP